MPKNDNVSQFDDRIDILHLVHAQKKVKTSLLWVFEKKIDNVSEC